VDDNRFPSRLLDGERVLWSGQHGQGVRLTGRDAFMIPFSLLWGGFAVFWEASVLRSNAPLFFALWGVPFVLVGVYMIIGRFFVDAWLRRNTRYAVTDRRTVIARSGIGSRLTSVSLDRLPDMQLSERSDGSGTIRFGPVMPYWGASGWGMWAPSLDPTPQFIAIDDARRVFDMIQQEGRAAS
jgi:hypothetical protein